MHFVSSVALGGIMRNSFSLAFSAVAATSISQIAKEFFTKVFLYPSQNLIPIGFMAVIALGIILGTVFLIKKLYDRVMKGKEAPPPP